MKARVTALASFLALVFVNGTPRTADACGVPTNVRTRVARTAIPRTSNPSRVLVIGDRANGLKRDLTAAGHRVDGAASSDAASGAYAVVIVDSPDEATRAQARFKDAVVLVRSGNVREDLKSLESRVARRVLDNSTRVVVARQAPRTVVNRGGGTSRTLVGNGTGTGEVTTTIAPHTDEVAAPATTLGDEVQFAYGRAQAPGAQEAIDRTVRWLAAHPSARVTLAGHADPSGSPAANLALGQARAEWVRDALIAAGVAASRIDVVSYGDTRLKYAPTDGRNRRVAIDVAK